MVSSEWSEPNSSLLGLPAAPPVRPWAVLLCLSGAAIACENGIVGAVISYTPTLRTPVFLLIGSLATGTSCRAGSHPERCVTWSPGRAPAGHGGPLPLPEPRPQLLLRTVLLTWGASLALGLMPVLGWNCLGALAASCGR